jgi:hypothetical protein
VTVKRSIALLAAALVLVSASAAEAKPRPKRIVPKGFYGMNWDGGIERFAAYDFRKKQWLRMRKNGAESARAQITWSLVQPREDQPPDWLEPDRLVKLASAYGLDLLPIVNLAPAWANGGSSDSYTAPDVQKYDQWLRTLIARYGPHGAFWKENPSLPYKPIRKWEVWNEPSIRAYFVVPKDQDWAVRYGELLRSAYRTIKNADRGATVVAAGLANYSWKDFDHLEKAGKIHGFFDVADVHPYTATRHGPLEIVRRFRAAMKKNGDAKKPLWVGELGLPASKGRTQDTSSLQTTDKGMARFLTESYADLVKNRKNPKFRVDRVYWYTWASIYYGDLIWHWAGLLRWDKQEGKDDFVTPYPALKAYRTSALRAEGIKR